MRPKFSPHHHSGRRMPHEHTAYGLLAFLLLFTGVIILGVTSQISADAGSGQGSFSVLAVVPGPPPSQTASISSPIGGQHFNSPLVSVSGNCQRGYLVRVFNGQLLAGAVFCTNSGHFNVQIQLFAGRNDLTALNYDNLDQSGPASSAVVVYYDVPAAFKARQGALTIKADQSYKAYKVGDNVRWPLEISGGVGPYAVRIDWGDVEPEILSRLNGEFEATHVYNRAGSGPRSSYDIIINATDAEGRTGFLALTVTIVSPAPILQTKPSTGGQLMIAWPMWVLAWLMLLFFWLGAYRFKRRHGHSSGSAPAGLSLN